MRRFTGQAATAGVLTECDFAELDDMNLWLLFVELTRARVYLERVLSAGAAHLITENLRR